MTIQLKTAFKMNQYVFHLGRFDPVLTNPGQFFIFGTKTWGFSTSSYHNPHDNDMMLYDITYEQIIVYKQSVMS